MDEKTRFLDKILSSIPETSDPIRMARYLYITYCQQCAYDPTFFLRLEALSKTDYKQLRAAQRLDSLKSEEEFKDGRLLGTCEDFSVDVAGLFNQTGELSAKTYLVDTDNADHVYILWNCINSPESIYLADPAFDIQRVQTGCRTQYFGRNPVGSSVPAYNDTFAEIPEKDLETYDLQNGYIPQAGMYQNIHMRSLEQEFSTRTDNIEGIVTDLLERISPVLPSNMGIVERKTSLKLLFGMVLREKFKEHEMEFQFRRNHRSIDELILSCSNGFRLNVLTGEELARLK